MKKKNGNGCVFKATGNRRKPYGVKLTKGWDETGKQIRVCVGYYKTQKEANKALLEYNDNPYNLEISNITFGEIYIKWSTNKFKKIQGSGIQGYKSAYEAIEGLHQMKFVDIKTTQLQYSIDESGKGYQTKRKIKSLLSQMYGYAIQNDISSKDYSSFVDIGKNMNESTRAPFTGKEIIKLWENIDNIEFIDTVLIMIYTGFRIGELLEMKIKNIDLENRTVTGGIKTEAGKNRLVPIHPRIYPLIEKVYKKDAEYLINNHVGKGMKYSNYYREKFIPIMEQLNMKHRPHDCRHTFATLLSNANANSVSIKKMIGHESYVTTEKIYTHKDIEELRKAVELIG